MNTTRGLRTGDLVTVPAAYRIPGSRERRTAVVESVAPDGLTFSDTTGVRHCTADAEKRVSAVSPTLGGTRRRLVP